MNFVTISPRRIIMAASTDDVKRVLLSSGIEVAAEIEISELLKGAGGLGCATGIINRK